MVSKTRMAQTLEGAEKIAAGFCGITVEEYRSLKAKGLKRCTKCKTWLPVSDFNNDKSRSDGLAAACRNCQNKMGRDGYTPIPESKRKLSGPPPKPKDGDKLQARQTVNRLVRQRRIPNPNTVPCSECGHLGNDKKHEYHHHKGYAAEHHKSVVVMCRSCHRKGDLNPKRIKQFPLCK